MTDDRQQRTKDIKKYSWQGAAGSRERTDDRRQTSEVGGRKSEDMMPNFELRIANFEF